MHITKVELEDIKSHAKSSFDFHRGTTAITGSNGAGKTTIIEAIAWTLFDLLDYKKDDFLRRGAKKGSVRVTFESHLDGRRYTVYRDTGTGYYVFDNELKTRIAEKKHEVSRFLQQHLGVEPGTDLETLFRSAIGVPQGTLTAIFLESPTTRKNAFDRLLKVEEYREGAEKLRETATFVKNRLQETQTRIARAEGELARFEELENSHRATEEKIASLEKDLQDLRELIAQKNEVVAKLDAAEVKINEMRARRDKTEVELRAQREAQARIQVERDKAFHALEKQKLIETDYLAHLAASDELKVLETKQTERAEIQREAQRVENRMIENRAELKRLDENLQKAVDAARQIQDLQPQIAEQTKLEAERAALVNSRAEAEQAAKEVPRLAEEIEKKRESYRTTSAQIKDAAQGAEAEAKIRELETQREKVEADLKEIVEAEASLKVLNPQREQLAKEIIRLETSLGQTEREISGFEIIREKAAQAAVLDKEENNLVAEIARLQAKIEHDEKFRGEVKNGLCPILSQRCLNLREGETLESYFQHELTANYQQLGSLKTERKTVSESLASAREAEKNFSRLEGLRRQSEQTKADLEQRRETLKNVESKIASFNNFKPQLLEDLRQQRERLAKEIGEWNERAGKFAGLRELETFLEGIKNEGKELSERQKKAEEVAQTLPAIEARLSEIEKRLTALASPRERAENLQREAARDGEIRAQIEKARENLTEFERSAAVFTEKLAQFASLDADLATVRATRERTSHAYQTYLANQAVAQTLPARESELAKAIEESERLAKEYENVLREFESAAANYNHEQHLNEKSALLDAQRREAALNAEFAQAQRTANDLRREIERLTEIRKQMQSEFQAKYKLERVAETTDFIRDTLKKAAPEVAKSYLFSISREANEIFREVSGSAERSLRWTEDYEIMLEERGHERPFVNLSGGEQMAAALSIRLALLKQLSDVRVAFFDEPTTNLDRERRERLAQQIGQIRNFDQLFVISHDDTFEENVDYHVQVGGRRNEDAAD